MRLYILDKHGIPQLERDTLKWAKWFTTADRVVKQSKVGGVVVSTVFLGLDHNHSGRGLYLLYETMVFGGEDDGYQVRSTTSTEALIAHDTTCAMVRVNQRNAKRIEQ